MNAWHLTDPAIYPERNRRATRESYCSDHRKRIHSGPIPMDSQRASETCNSHTASPGATVCAAKMVKEKGDSYCGLLRSIKFLVSIVSQNLIEAIAFSIDSHMACFG